MRRKWIYADGSSVYSETAPDDWCGPAYVDERVPVDPAPPNRKQRRAAAARERQSGTT